MFKQKIFGIVLVIILAGAGGIIFNTGCYDDSQARVTIHLERNDLAVNRLHNDKKIIDLIMEFFSKRAEASLPPPWSNTQGSLNLVITSPAFDKKTFSIPIGVTTYSTIIPAANDVTFEVISTVSSIKNWGGHTTVSVRPGEQNVTIKMIPMTYFHEYYCCNTISWVPTTPAPANADSYVIYRSLNSNGPYSILKTIPNITTGTDIDTFNMEMDTTYYYKIAVSGSDGEGLLSDPVSVLYNP